MTKFCKDCMWHSKKLFMEARCWHPLLTRVDLVDGSRTPNWCSVQRIYDPSRVSPEDPYCGKSGGLFESKYVPNKGILEGY